MLAQRRERDDHKFCTVAYVRLETDEGDEACGVRTTAADGDHSPPICALSSSAEEYTDTTSIRQSAGRFVRVYPICLS